MITVSAVVVALIGVSLWAYELLKAKPASRLEAMAIAKLPNTSRSARVAISPDGKYIVHAVTDGGQQGLWLKQVATGSDVQIVGPARAHYLTLAFSHDGNYVYYTKWDDNASASVLYKMPALGGASKKLIVNVSGDFTLSPDGKRIAFARDNQQESTLTVASEDAEGEQKLAVRKLPDRFKSPAWSPDGEVIVCSAVSADPASWEVVEARVADGIERPLTPHRWRHIYGITWLPDGSGLLLTGIDAFNPSQVWQLSYPGGELRQITNDLNNYFEISLTEDSGTLATRRSEFFADIWIVPIGDTTIAKQITSGSSKYQDVVGAPDGKVIYTSFVRGRGDIWIMEPDGSGQRQLTVGAGGNYSPSVSRDGHYIFFESDRTGPDNIWRMDIDGDNLKQLTHGKADRFPHVSPDGKWVVYTSFDSSTPTLWKTSINGGDAVPLTDKYSSRPSFSPDGKLIACFYKDKQEPSVSRMALISSEGGQPVRMFDTQSTVRQGLGVRWAPDGGALTYVDCPEGVCNFWSQPVDGGPPKQLTNFESDQIWSFDLMPDGKRLVCSRGNPKGDLVMISNFR